jgi:hypothetical protein
MSSAFVAPIAPASFSPSERTVQKSCFDLPLLPLYSSSTGFCGHSIFQFNEVFTVKLAALAFLFPLSLLSQEFRGAVSGEVADSSGSLVAGAEVTVAETHTGTKNETVTDTSGKYNALFLLPGDYDIDVSAPGFKGTERKGLHIGAGEHPIIDFKLVVGDTAQAIEVTADIPIVNSENASVGQAVTTREVEDIPLNGRTPIMLAQLAVGVIPSPYNSTLTLVHPFDTNNAFAIGGTVNQTSESCSTARPTPHGMAARPTVRLRTPYRKCA